MENQGIFRDKDVSMEIMGNQETILKTFKKKRQI
jgi:hypothetical protein